MAKGVRERDDPALRDDRGEHTALQLRTKQADFWMSNKALGLVLRFIVFALFLGSMKGTDLGTALTLLNRILKSALG